MPPGPHRRQPYLSALGDIALEARGVQGTLRISFPCPIVVMGGFNLPEGQELVGRFAYGLVSGYWRVRTGVARIGEEGTVTTVGVLGLKVITGWQQRKAEWVDVAWLGMRVHVGRQQTGGFDVIDVEGEDDAPPSPSARKRKAQPPLPPQGDTDAPPPQKAPRTANPAEWAEPPAGRRQRGVVGEWVEQQHQLQRVGAWEVRAVSAEAADRDLEARLSRANDDRRATETRLAEVTKEKDRLVTRVKTLEHPGALAKPPAQTEEAAEGAEGPPGGEGGRRGGGGNAVGVRYLLAGAQAWHAQAEACAGHMSAVSTGLRMAMLASGQQVEVDTVAPNMAGVSAAHDDVRRQYPPYRPTLAAMDPSFAEAVVQQSSQGSASRSTAPGGWACSSPFNFGTTCPF